MWALTMLLVHVSVLAALLTLCRGAPKSFPHYVVLWLLIASALVFVAYFAAEMVGAEWHWQVKHAAYLIEHFAVILSVFRLFVADQERRCLPSSQQSPSSLRS